MKRKSFGFSHLTGYLTTWRMDARAATLETQVGQAMQDIVTSKPLLVRPQTPRFFVAGDEARLGALVQNNTDQAVSTTVSLSAEGLTLRQAAEQNIKISPMDELMSPGTRWSIRTQCESTW